MRIASKDVVQKATAARLQSGSCMLDAEPRSVLEKVL
jgi:hypothetical protein